MTDTNLLIQKESFFKKFVKHKLATVAFVILAIEVIGIYLGPVFFNLDPYYIDTAALGAAPSTGHILGTDDIGWIFSPAEYMAVRFPSWSVCFPQSSVLS